MPRGKKPREYPPEIVELACSMYLSGMTVREIAAEFPKGYKVQTILERYLPERRSAAKRDQRGANNHMWRGDSAGYKALHLRVAAQRGKPQKCMECEVSGEGKYEWANLTGRYEDVNDYARMCLPCHRSFDAARRRVTGKRTSPLQVIGGDANV